MMFSTMMLRTSPGRRRVSASPPPAISIDTFGTTLFAMSRMPLQQSDADGLERRLPLYGTHIARSSGWLCRIESCFHGLPFARCKQFSEIVVEPSGKRPDVQLAAAERRIVHSEFQGMNNERLSGFTIDAIELRVQALHIGI